MRDVLATVDGWLAAGRRAVLVRVVDLEGSGPRGPGAAMAVSDTGEVAGSVSGGCVEGAVVAEALDVLGVEPPGLGPAAPGAGSGSGPGAPRMVSFGWSDEDALAVGLTCGGTVGLFLEPLDHPGGLGDAWPVLRGAVGGDRPVAVATVVEGPGLGRSLVVEGDGAVTGGLGDAGRDHAVARDALGELGAGRSCLRHYGSHGEADEAAVSVFVEVFAPPPRLLVFGAVDFAAALSRVATVLGYRVTVCDAREVFATEVRFPAAHDVVVDWPHRLLERVGPTLTADDAVCVLTHDARFDVPAIRAALATGVGYIGVMGSRRTHEHRLRRLAEAGVTEPRDLGRLHSPVGLDIGARTPEETAVAIVAEVIALRSGRPARHLRDTTGPIHGTRAEPGHPGAPRHPGRRPPSAGTVRGVYARLVNRFSATRAGSWLVKHVASRVDPVVFRATGGRFTSTGPPTLPMLSLTTTGRRSGQPRTVQLAFHRDGADLLVVASAMGQDHHPAWRHNLEAHPEAEVRVRGETFPVTATLLDPAEKQRLWPAIRETIPQMATYERRTDREIGVFRLRRR